MGFFFENWEKGKITGVAFVAPNPACHSAIVRAFEGALKNPSRNKLKIDRRNCNLYFIGDEAGAHELQPHSNYKPRSTLFGTLAFAEASTDLSTTNKILNLGFKFALAQPKHPLIAPITTIAVIYFNFHTQLATNAIAANSLSAAALRHYYIKGVK